VLRRTRGDLDGDGSEEAITLFSDGTLETIDAEGHVTIEPLSDTTRVVEADIHVVELDRGASIRAILVTLPTDGDEDPPARHQLFVKNGGALEKVLELFARDRPFFPGDGTARRIESAWQACERLGHPQGREVRLDEIILGFGDDGVMRERARSDSGKRFDCAMLAACPFVYVVDAAGTTFVGEILRHMRGRDAYGLQSLSLPPRDGAVLRLRLSEEKPEVTFLDEIYLEVGGERIAPRACGRESASYCESDTHMHVLEQGQTLELEFELPAGSGEPKLFARGYYLAY
jgi:hypothetical protein